MEDKKVKNILKGEDIKAKKDLLLQFDEAITGFDDLLNVTNFASGAHESESIKSSLGSSSYITPALEFAFKDNSALGSANSINLFGSIKSSLLTNVYGNSPALWLTVNPNSQYASVNGLSSFDQTRFGSNPTNIYGSNLIELTSSNCIRTTGLSLMPPSETYISLSKYTLSNRLFNTGEFYIYKEVSHSAISFESYSIPKSPSNLYDFFIEHAYTFFRDKVAKKIKPQIAQEIISKLASKLRLIRGGFPLIEFRRAISELRGRVLQLRNLIKHNIWEFKKLIITPSVYIVNRGIEHSIYYYYAYPNNDVEFIDVKNTQLVLRLERIGFLHNKFKYEKEYQEGNIIYPRTHFRDREPV